MRTIKFGNLFTCMYGYFESGSTIQLYLDGLSLSTSCLSS